MTNILKHYPPRTRLSTVIADLRAKGFILASRNPRNWFIATKE